MAKYLFGGFQRCLYPVQKFQSDPERRLAVILERESLKWFKPAKGQFQIYYKWGAERPEYQPDFVAETAERIYMLEPKAANQMKDAEVLAKRDAAVEWCQQASQHALSYNGKQWKYLLIPHVAIADNMTLEGLALQFAVD
jgi:type III restriction enzyme